MTNDFTVQCEQCGTIYPDTDEVCPYCGQSQPLGATYAGPGVIDDFYTDQSPLPDAAYEGISPDDGYPAVAAAQTDADFGEAGPDEYDEYGEGYEYGEPALAEYGESAAYPDDEYADEETEPEPHPHRFAWSRWVLGCLGLFVCIGLFYGGIALIAAYQGVQEQTADIQAQADEHYRRGQAHQTKNELELAIAEFELALSLNPNLLAAREALREAQRQIQAQPTPTSETRLAAATSLLSQAETQITQQQWAEAVKSLTGVRGIDPDYQAQHVSDLLYQASYQLGLQLLTPDRISEAVSAFDQALAERPNDEAVMQQKTRAVLYQTGKTAFEQKDWAKTIDALRQLYQQDNTYLDVKQRLLDAYVQLGDGLAARNEWCQAKAQYVEAVILQPNNDSLQTKSTQSNQRCREMGGAQLPPTLAAAATRPAPRPVTPVTATLTVTATAPLTASTTHGSGRILFAAFNPNESRWEIMSISPAGGAPQLLAVQATMPALSPDGRLLVYHSELIASEGLHLLNLTNGQDTRLTMFKQHILPRWGGDNTQFLFVAQDPGTSRWQIYLGYADGQGQPVILRDGRTPALSPDNKWVAYQGADAQGNNPGIYLAPVNGGEAVRLTNHESDRAPAFSPDGAQLAYMSTRNGNWDIYVISTAGSAPRQLTTTPGNDGLPVWSPNGQEIAQVSDAGGSWAIDVVNVAGGAPVKVTAWDGSHLADWLLAQIEWVR